LCSRRSVCRKSNMVTAFHLRYDEFDSLFDFALFLRIFFKDLP
jgi:hypothetical protein